MFVCSFAWGDASKNIVVLANKKVPESLVIAKDYCMARSIPQANILQLDLPAGANLSRAAYDSQIAKPVFEFLKKRKLIRVSGKAADFRENIVTASLLDYLVICKGVPYRILETPKPEGAEKPSLMRVDSASVDSELALLLRGTYKLEGNIPNPAFSLEAKSGDYKNFTLVCVARLDGPSFEIARNLYKSALAAERDGLRGRAYIDLGKKYPQGDKWLENAKNVLEEMGFDISLEPTARLMGYADRMDAAAFYFGWYTQRAYGYFNDPSFNMAPGASALHIYSFSASNLNSRASWTGALAAANAAATFGNIDEPLLGPTHRPDAYCAFIARGFEAGEAALCAIPALSWKGVFLGDPLYSPFKVSFDEQMKKIDAGNFDDLSQYSIIRKMNLIEKERGVAAAFDFGEKYARILKSNCALNWKLGEICQKIGKENDAINFARAALEQAMGKFETYGLAFEILRWLDSKGFAQENSSHLEAMVSAAWEGHDDFLKAMLPSLLKKDEISEESKERYREKLLELNPPPKETPAKAPSAKEAGEKK